MTKVSVPISAIFESSIARQLDTQNVLRILNETSEAFRAFERARTESGRSRNMRLQRDVACVLQGYRRVDRQMLLDAYFALEVDLDQRIPRSDRHMGEALRFLDHYILHDFTLPAPRTIRSWLAEYEAHVESGN
ncbi:hypothetical protein [Agrobacterium cavarae]|uniref:hypothetical protein n=1 Tax=Agrobacterium cavarae TaxID=2528239 RepID=UPI0028AA6128|nr:hypothetical protein [Agrobacterium cavarae]